MTAVIAYVVSGSLAVGGGAVTPVDTRTHIAGPTIILSGLAQSIIATAKGKTVYVPVTDQVSGLSAVIPIRTSNNVLHPPIPVGKGAFAMVLTPNGRFLYVAADSGNSVTPIRVATNSPLADIPVGNSCSYGDYAQWQNRIHSQCG